jgi:hypothetical protein
MLGFGDIRQVVTEVELVTYFQQGAHYNTLPLTRGSFFPFGLKQAATRYADTLFRQP